jgi:hypothetical protein
MYFSSVLDSSAGAFSAQSVGGGAFAIGGFLARYSRISGNSASAYTLPSDSFAGGLCASGAVTIVGSTISNNRADYSAGVLIGRNYITSSFVANSTVTGNIARFADGGIGVTVQPIAVLNSTIAFNEARGDLYGGSGIFLSLGAVLTLRSSIVAANLNSDGPSDIGGVAGTSLSASSKDNLINASSLPLPPSSAISDCPRLDPLTENGGPTPTHQPQQASKAIDAGDNDIPLDSDQRQGPRVIGPRADIGAVERAPTDHNERIFLGRFDATCEW